MAAQRDTGKLLRVQITQLEAKLRALQEEDEDKEARASGWAEFAHLQDELNRREQPCGVSPLPSRACWAVPLKRLGCIRCQLPSCTGRRGGESALETWDGPRHSPMPAAGSARPKLPAPAC